MRSDERQKRKKLLRNVLQVVMRRRASLIAALATATIAATASLYIPRLIGNAVDCMTGPNEVDFSELGRLALRIGVCALVAAACQWTATFFNTKAAYETSRDLRDAAFAKLGKLPLKYIDGRPHGDVASRIVSDADQFADGLLLGFAQFFTGAVAIVCILYFMLSTNVKIALAIAATTPLSLAVAAVISKRSFTLFQKQTQLRGAETDFVVEATQGARVLQAYNRGEISEREFEALDDAYADAARKATFVSSLTNPATRFVNSLAYALAGVIGALAVVHGRLSVGQLLVFLTYADQYAKPFNEISSVATEFQNSLACAERLFELIEEEEEEPDPPNATSPLSAEGRVEFDSVYFSYSPDRPLIENFQLTVPPGSRVAIVGPTGSGKTTLANLLMRFYETDSGAIRLDERSIRDLSRRGLRSLFGMVLQDAWLKTGTIRENILLGAEATEEEFRRIAEASRVDQFARRLPDGYDSIATEDSFSQGQRQLICVARAMARNPQLLILDEATSSIDVRAEQKIQEAFNALTEGRTSFVVAHRLATIRNADVILAMKDGKVVEQGTHEELVAKRGFYFELYSSQFE